MINSDKFIRNSFRSLLSDGDPNGSEKKSAVGESVLLMATVLAMVCGGSAADSACQRNCASGLWAAARRAA